MEQVKQYTVCILLNHDGSKVLLQLKDRTTFAGMLNGIGGKVENGEEPMLGALREIQEETTIESTDIKDFTWIGTLIIPEQCDTNNKEMIPEIIFYAGIVKNEANAHKAPDETEEINWYTLRKDTPIIDLELAGNGNLSYFIGIARRLLFNENPVNFK